MSVKTNVNTSQKARGNNLSPHFVRQVRNFINNWVVEGGNIHFDGYRVKLRVNPQPKTFHPFEIVLLGDLDFRVESGNVYGLTFDMIDNGYIDFNTIDVPSVSLSTTTATDNDVTYIYLEIPYDSDVSGTFATTVATNHGLIYMGTPSLVATTTLPEAAVSKSPFKPASGDNFRVYIGAVEAVDGVLSISTQNHTGHWWDSISGTMYYVPPV